jgi:type II secretory ATPase GspE/PulE/Tfp pilus assembly ATPase PilB-like protein
MEMMMEKEFETLPERYRDRVPTNRTVLHPEPTPECATGLRGRVAVMEALEVDDGMQELILNNASEEDFYHHARKHGFMSMKEDAIIKALNHVIPQEEVSLFGTKVGVENLTDEMVQDVSAATEEETDSHVDNSSNRKSEAV